MVRRSKRLNKKPKFNVGTTIRKEFDAGWFIGEVIDVSSNDYLDEGLGESTRRVEHLYQIVYSDGEPVEMEEYEVEQHLFNPNQDDQATAGAEEEEDDEEEEEELDERLFDPNQDDQATAGAEDDEEEDEEEEEEDEEEEEELNDQLSNLNLDDRATGTDDRPTSQVLDNREGQPLDSHQDELQEEGTDLYDFFSPITVEEEEKHIFDSNQDDETSGVEDRPTSEEVLHDPEVQPLSTSENLNQEEGTSLYGEEMEELLFGPILDTPAIGLENRPTSEVLDRNRQRSTMSLALDVFLGESIRSQDFDREVSRRVSTPGSYVAPRNLFDGLPAVIYHDDDDDDANVNNRRSTISEVAGLVRNLHISTPDSNIDQNELFDTAPFRTYRDRDDDDSDDDDSTVPPSADDDDDEEDEAFDGQVNIDQEEDIDDDNVLNGASLLTSNDVPNDQSDIVLCLDSQANLDQVEEEDTKDDGSLHSITGKIATKDLLDMIPCCDGQVDSTLSTDFKSPDDREVKVIQSAYDNKPVHYQQADDDCNVKDEDEGDPLVVGSTSKTPVSLKSSSNNFSAGKKIQGETIEAVRENDFSADTIGCATDDDPRDSSLSQTCDQSLSSVDEQATEGNVLEEGRNREEEEEEDNESFSDVETRESEGHRIVEPPSTNRSFMRNMLNGMQRSRQGPTHRRRRQRKFFRRGN